MNFVPVMKNNSSHAIPNRRQCISGTRVSPFVKGAREARTQLRMPKSPGRSSVVRMQKVGVPLVGFVCRVR
jgi:hypothetical protein